MAERQKSMTKKELVRDIVCTEFAMFDQVQNQGGRADCQDNWPAFSLMRGAQFLAWDEKTLLSYREDLARAEEEGRNPVSEKYAYMMEYSSPEEFEQIRNRLPVCSPEKLELIEEALKIFLRQTEDFMEKYPSFRRRSRPIYAEGDSPNFTSIETYTRGELKTYSEETLHSYLEWMKKEEAEGRKIVNQIYENTVYGYGYSSLEEADRAQRK